MPKPRAKTREVRRRIWEFIRDYRRENLYGPNLREIAEAVGISSASNVNYHVKPMIEQGLLTGNSNARSLNVNSGIPIVGTGLRRRRRDAAGRRGMGPSQRVRYDRLP